MADMRDPKVYLYKVADITSNSRRVRWENAVESDGQTHTGFQCTVYAAVVFNLSGHGVQWKMVKVFF